MNEHYIIPLIRSLNEKERRIVEDHIIGISSLGSATNESLQLKLYRILTQNEKADYKKIGTLVATKNLSSLLYHLAEKVQDALLLSKHIQNHQLFEERERVLFDLKKQTLFVKVLYKNLNQGKSQTIQIIIDNIIKSAKDFQVFDVLIEILGFKKYLRGIRGDQNEFEAVQREIEFYNETLSACMRAAETHYKLVMDSVFIKKYTDREVSELLDRSIKMMKLDYKKYKAEEINYYMHLCIMAMHEKRMNYSASLQSSKQLITLLRKSKVIFSKARVALAYMHTCHYNIFLDRYNEALKAAANAEKFLLPDSFNYYSVRQQEFFAHFYNKSFSKAHTKIDELISAAEIDSGSFRISKFIYFKACVFFSMQNYKEALQLLNKSLEIEKDKTGWNVSLRILLVMVYIELKKFDEATNALESLRKFVERNTTDKMAQRNIIILKALRNIEKNDYRINETTMTILRSLKDDKGKFFWQKFSPELIRFDSWALNKFPKKS